MPALDPSAVDFAGGLLPAVVQHSYDGRVLMVGYMNAEALQATLSTRSVTFYSRSKGRLWTKGESSGHLLRLIDIAVDCDGDALLVLAEPVGPTCHRLTATCFDQADATPAPGPALGLLAALDRLIEERQTTRPAGSYTTRLFESGIKRIAQKVGEEGVESALAAIADDDQALLGELADLWFHSLVLLRARGLGLAKLLAVLAARHKPGLPATPSQD